MLEILTGLFECAREPVMIGRENEIVYRNPAAVSLGEDAVLPDELRSQPMPFVGAVTINGESFQVSCTAAGEYRVYMLYPVGMEVKNLLASAGASLKNSVMTMQTVARLLSDSQSSGDYQAVLNHQIHSVNRIAGNMMYLGDAETSGEKGLVDLVELLGDLVHSVNVLTNGRTAVIDFSSKTGSIDMYLSGGMAERLVLNLISNSLKATPRDGSVSVNVEKKGDRAVITVTDTGKGIPQDILPRLFSSYTLERGLNEKHKSIGMGLAVVQGIVHQMGGTIMAVSEEGKGTSVTVSLPIEKPSELEFRSPNKKYVTKAMTRLQTELCDVLGADCYSEVFGD